MQLRTNDSAAEQYAASELAASELIDVCRYFARNLTHPLVTSLMIEEEHLDILVAWNDRIHELLEVAETAWSEYQTLASSIELLLDGTSDTQASIAALSQTLDDLLALRSEEAPHEPPLLLHLAAQAEWCYQAAIPIFDLDHDARKCLAPEALAIIDDISDEVKNHLSWVDDVLFEYEDGPATVQAAEVELRHIRQEVALRVDRFRSLMNDPQQLREQ